MDQLMAMAKSRWTEEDYDTVYWPLLRTTLDTVLLEPPGSYKPISYEQMYSAVYKCVCTHHSERLHNDLVQHIEAILSSWQDTLTNHVERGDRRAFILEVDKIMTQFFAALGSIVPIFTYLNRFYVESRFNTSLSAQLYQLFAKNLSDRFVQEILTCIEASPPFSLSPAMVQKILQHLHTLNSQYYKLNTSLFARHLPGLQEPMSEEDLQAQIEADKKLQEELRLSGFDSGNQNRKRGNPDQVATS